MILNYDMKGYYFKLKQTEEESDILYEIYKNDVEKWQSIRDNDDFMRKSIYIDMSDNDGLVFCNEDCLKGWIAYFDLIGYNYEYRNACDLLFNEKLDISMANDTMKKTIEQYIFNNFEVNDVLDKLNNNIQLTEMDYRILKSI